MHDPAFTAAPQATVDGLREAFARAEFTGDRLSDAGFADPALRADEEWALRSLAPKGALSALVRLWTLGAAVGAAEAAPALKPVTLDELVAAGLLERADGDRTRATVAVRPYRDLLITSDRAREALAEPADFVPGVNPVARLLAHHTVRLPVGSALDLGTGNAMQALAAARHSGDVVAVDLNPRALAYARLNARLNGIGNVRFLAGSWFEPVAERRFELIVANPPFVISPDAALGYRDSGLAPGELSATLARGIDEHLASGGFGHLTCEWGVEDGDAWFEAPRRWLAAVDSDAVVLRHAEADPLEHAVAWNGRLAAAFPDRFEEAVERWARHHREHGFRAIAAGTVILRRRADRGKPWFSALELASGPSAEAGEHVRGIFAGEDVVQAAGEGSERLLNERLRPAEGLRVEQVITAREGRWRRRRAKLRVRPGLGVEGRVDADVLDVVFALDGRREVEQIVRDVAERRGADEAALRALALAELPGLVRRALLLPHGRS